MKTKTKQNYFEQFRQLTKRHLLVFFNNKMRVFFTLMVPFIIFVIYILFLRKLELDQVNLVFSDFSIPKDDKQLNYYIGSLVDSWMLSGIIALSTITVSLQTNTIIVNDKENGINRDFASSPVSNTVLIVSYFIFTFIVTLLVCFIFLMVCLIYLAALGELMLTFNGFAIILGVLIYSTINSVLFTVFICSFVSRDSTMASILTIFSSAMGFLIGAFMPLSMLPSFVGTICGFIPGSYCCSLFRFSFMSNTIEEMSGYIMQTYANGGQVIENLTANFGYDIKFFIWDVTPAYQAIAVAVFTVFLLIANIIVGNKLTNVVGGMKKKLFRKNKRKS